MPPIIAASIDAGSGPILRPKGASRRFAAAPITPGCSVIGLRGRPISQRRQLSPSSTSTESVIAWPDRLVPAARNVTASEACAVAEQAHHFLLALDHDDDLRHEPIEARVGAPGQQPQRIGDQAIVRDERRQPRDTARRTAAQACARTLGSGTAASMCDRLRIGQCTTSAVNGQTYACAMISSPISAASARLWKNT